MTQPQKTKKEKTTTMALYVAITILLMVLSHNTVWSQNKDSLITEKPSAINGDTVTVLKKKPAVLFYAELLGNGVMFSINCEIRLSQKMYLRGGYGFLESAGENSFPVMLNYLHGSGEDFVEFGAGLTFTTGGYSYQSPISVGTTVNPTITIGYRFLTETFIFKIGWTPIFAGASEGSTMRIVNLIGLGIGIGF